MIILKPVAFCIVSMIIILFMKNIFPEFVPLIALISGVIVIVYIIPYAKSVLDIVYYLDDISSGVNNVIKLTLKIVIVSLVCEFASQLCNDCGEGYLASKINFVCKIAVLSILSPVIISFVENILELMNVL